MPSACESKSEETNKTAADEGSSEPVTQASQDTNGVNGTSTATTSAGSNGYIEEDVDDEMPAKPDGDTTTAASQEAGGEKKTEEPSDDSFIFQDTSFNVKISAPGTEPFDLLVRFNLNRFIFPIDDFLQVSPMELVQEINHQLIDREDTCHRTCFSLQLNGNTLDNFTELKNIEGLKEGSVIKVIEEPYTVREARIHVRHVRDLLKSLDLSDAYNGIECSSLSFMNIIAQNDLFDVKSNKSNKSSSSLRSELFDCLPPDYVLPSESSSGANAGSTSPGAPTNNNVPNNGATTGATTAVTASATNQRGDIQLTPLEPQTKDQPKIPSALKVLTASGWNPPPGLRKLRGDLMYLYVVTLEEKRIHVTSSSRGFYVNQSTDEVFNPKPANPKLIFHSLVDLLAHLSPAFKRNYTLIQKRRHQRHPFERLLTPYQVYAWTAPQLEHTVDSIRAEDAFSSKLGYEEHMPGQTRDWNEELQTTREMPRKTLSERVIRERAIFKVHSDFVAAATRGAMAVVDGNVIALNPNEDTKMQMFIWNNIFFSLGFDVRDHYKELGGDAAAFAAPCNDLNGVRAYSVIDIEGIYTLATAVIDYKGYRVTAQSIIPGILERDQEQSVVYGSIDFGKTVVANPKYLELLNKAGQMLKIVPHKVISKNEEEVEICSSVECKGIIGNDGRHYILDLLRTFPPDPNYMVTDSEELSKEMRDNGYPRTHKHKLCSLRQELVDSFFESRYLLFIKLAAFYLQQSDLKKLQLKSTEEGADVSGDDKEGEKPEEEKTESKISAESEAEKSVDGKEVPENYKKIAESIASPDAKSSTAAEKTNNALDFENTREIIRRAATDVGSLSETEFDLRFNPDIFSPGVLHANPESETFQKQKKLIKDAAEFLIKVQMPSLVSLQLFSSTTYFSLF